MTPTLCVPESMAEPMAAFIEAESIPVELVSADGSAPDAAATVRVGEPKERLQCDLTTLHRGGWITCETARAMAPRLEISMMDVGKLLDFLNIKVRQCELGCFK